MSSMGSEFIESRSLCRPMKIDAFVHVNLMLQISVSVHWTDLDMKFKVFSNYKIFASNWNHAQNCS